MILILISRKLITNELKKYNTTWKYETWSKVGQLFLHLHVNEFFAAVLGPFVT